jgi:integration host factor subunit beta
MNKGDLVEALREETGLTRHNAEAVVDMFFGAMTDTLVEGGRVEIRGLCSIYVRDYKGYVGRNPKTKKPVQVGAKKLPFFKCGKELKERVDSGQT